MASGNTLAAFDAPANKPPASSAAIPDTRNNIPVLDFNDAADREARFIGRLNRLYAGGGITASLQFLMSSATSGNVVLGVSVERHDTGSDLDSDSFASEVTATVAVPGTSGASGYADIALTNGAQIDSLAVGEGFRLKVRRLGSSGSDTATGDLELVTAELRET